MATTVHELRAFRGNPVRVDVEAGSFVGTIVQDRLGDQAVMFLLDTGAEHPVVIELDATYAVAEVDPSKAGESRT